MVHVYSVEPFPQTIPVVLFQVGHLGDFPNNGGSMMKKSMNGQGWNNEQHPGYEFDHPSDLHCRQTNAPPIWGSLVAVIHRHKKTRYIHHLLVGGAISPS